MPASLARAGTLAHIGSAAISGTAAAHGHDCGGIYRRRSGRTEAGVWVQAFRKTDERGGSKTSPRHGTERNSWSHTGQNRSVHHIVRALWISRIARGQLCVCFHLFYYPPRASPVCVFFVCRPLFFFDFFFLGGFSRRRC